MASSNNTTSGNNQTDTLGGFLFSPESPDYYRAFQQLAAEQPPPAEAVVQLLATATPGTATPQGLGQWTENNWPPANGTAGSTSFLKGFGESINTNRDSRTPTGVPIHLPGYQAGPGNNNYLLTASVTPGTATPQGLGQWAENNWLPANGTAGSTSFLQGIGESINTNWDSKTPTGVPTRLPGYQAGPGNNSKLATVTPGTATSQGLGQWTNNNGIPANVTADSTSFLQGFDKSINTNRVSAAPHGVPGHLPSDQAGLSNNSNLVTEHVNPPPPRPRRGRPRSAKVLAAVNLGTATRRGLAESTINSGVIEHVKPASSQPRRTRPSPTAVSVGRCGDIPSRPLYQRTTSNKTEFYASNSSAVTHTSPGKLASSSNYVPELMCQVQQEQPPNHNRKRPKNVTAEEIDEQLRKRRYPDNGVYDPLYQAFGQHIDPFFDRFRRLKNLRKPNKTQCRDKTREKTPTMDLGISDDVLQLKIQQNRSQQK